MIINYLNTIKLSINSVVCLNIMKKEVINILKFLAFNSYTTLIKIIIYYFFNLWGDKKMFYKELLKNRLIMIDRFTGIVMMKHTTELTDDEIENIYNEYAKRISHNLTTYPFTRDERNIIHLTKTAKRTAPLNSGEKKILEEELLKLSSKIDRFRDIFNSYIGCSVICIISRSGGSEWLRLKLHASLEDMTPYLTRCEDPMDYFYTAIFLAP